MPYLAARALPLVGAAALVKATALARAAALAGAAAALAGAVAASARGGEEGRTRGLKLSPPQVLATLGLVKRWRGLRGSLL